MKMRSIIILAAIPIALLLQGCLFYPRFYDVSARSPYAEMMGKKFVLKQDCYACGNVKAGKLSVGVPGRFLPAVSPLFINKKLDNGIVIAGILNQGSVFTIVGCIDQYDPENGHFGSFKATFETPSFQGVIFDVSELTDMAKVPPEFLDSLAKPLE